VAGVLSYTAGVLGSGRNDGANGLLPVLTGQELDWLQVLSLDTYLLDHMSAHLRSDTVITAQSLLLLLLLLQMWI
jgi:hypothetical protein